MKKKLLTIIIAVAIMALLPSAAFAALGGDGTSKTPYTVSSAAEFEQAIEEGGSTIYIKLAGSFNADLVIPEGKTVSLDLNNKTLTNSNGHTITVENDANLTITGSGTVDNVKHAKAAIWNEGTVTLNGGKYDRSEENGQSSSDSGGNSYYVLVNHGTMTVNTGVEVTQDGHFSSLFENGYYSYNSGNASSGYVEGTNAEFPELTINGGTFSGGLNTIKNDDGATLTINGGTFKNTSQAAFLNWNIATVNGGTFSSDGNCILNGGGDDKIDKGDLTINGGTFNSTKDAIAAMNNKPAYLDGVKISGGQFSSDVTAYLIDGYATAEINGKTIVVTDTVDPVATVGEYGFNNIANAVIAANTGAGDVVVLKKNTTYNTRINVTKNLTLDLGGYTLTSNTSHSFVVNPDISFTVENGTLKNTVGTAIFGLKGSTINLNKDAVLDVLDGIVATNNSADEGNTTINVYGTINSTDIAVWGQGPKNNVKLDGANITANYFAVYQNGSYGGSTYTIKNSTIYNGEDAGPAIYISNNKNNANNPDQGWQTLNVENSTITGSAGIEVKYTNVNLTNCTVTATAAEPTFEQYNNGSTTAGFAVVASDNTMKPNDPKPEGQININGGNYKGLVGLSSLIDANDYPDFKETTYRISSGYFTSNIPGSYLEEGKAVLTSDKADYAFMVGDKVEAEAEPATGDPVVNDSSLPSDMSDEDKTAVTEAAATVKDDGELAAAANSAVEKVSEADKTAAENAYKASSIPGAGDETNINIYAQTYLDITPTAYNKDEGKLTLDITPMYRVVASTADNANDIKILNEVEQDANAVVLAGSEKELTNIQTMTISIQLPADFPTTNLYVKHTNKNGALVGYHTAKVSDDGTLTFTNDKGFSTFEIAQDSRTAIVDFDGTQVTLTPADVNNKLPEATPTDNKKFGGWKFADLEGFTGAYTTLSDELLTALVNKGETVIATPYFYSSSSGGGSVTTTYTVTVENSANGSVTADVKSAAKDDTVTLTAKANEGYELSTITVTDASGKEVKLTDKGNGVYTFAMPAANVTVKSTFKEVQVSELPFTDVAKDAWYYNSVKYVYENDMMKGTEDTLFSPNTSITRGMIVTILYRLEQQPAVTADKLFADVADDAYYSKAIAWAAANDIVAGYDNGNFGPNDTITREQLAAILYRYANYKGYDVSAKADLTKYPDYNQISSYAVNAMTWANAEGLIGGTDKGTLDPKGDASRAQAATILMRFCENVAK